MSVFVIAILINVLILFIWTPLIIKFRQIFLILIFDVDLRVPSGEPIRNLGSIDYLSLNNLPFLVSLFRLTLLVIFISSCLLKPFVLAPINLVWRRIVESDKPVFTLAFGGTAAFASAIIEAAKHL
jgi:hypothetical protein